MEKIKEDNVIIPEVVEEMKEVKEINKNAIATIHNDLIQARHKLSLEEIRLMDTIISFIQPEDKDFKKYKIPVAVFKDLFGTQRKDIYDVVKRAVEGLLSKPIKIEKKNERGKRYFKMFNFIRYGEYEEGAGCFYVSIAPEFKPYLLQLKEFFSKIPIKYTYVLNSRYAIRLYELLKQYENTGFRVDYLPELREMLGVEPNEYIRFDNFEKRVLKQAVKEINEKTD
ncbi:replication initiation protein, partial [Hydrogenivirga sp. 128-5-R1-1]|uniref:replication initiation protein n=1 Tax=Hydrogenivirga sp. 128-5-R1-1 TaxID=392423 RepID=UPI00015EF6A9